MAVTSGVAMGERRERPTTKLKKLVSKNDAISEGSIFSNIFQK